MDLSTSRNKIGGILVNWGTVIKNFYDLYNPFPKPKPNTQQEIKIPKAIFSSKLSRTPFEGKIKLKLEHEFLNNLFFNFIVI